MSSFSRGRGSNGGADLLHDVQDLQLLVARVHSNWTVVEQSARAVHDQALDATARACGIETHRQSRWLETILRDFAPQIVTVPPAT